MATGAIVALVELAVVRVPSYRNGLTSMRLDIVTVIDNLLLGERDRRELLKILVHLVENMKAIGVIDELSNPRSALSEAYRSLATALQFSTNAGLPKTLSITSSGPGEGKSTTSIAIA